MGSEAEGFPSTFLDGDLVEQVPDSIRLELGAEEKVLVAVSGDLTPQNQYGRSWLIVTGGRLYAYGSEGDEGPTAVIPLSEVEDVEVRRFVGNDVLVVKTPDRAVEALRATKTHAPKMDRARLALLGLLHARGKREAERPVGPTVEDGGGRQVRCSKCGRVIPPWTTVCPACISRRAVIWRILQYVRPYRLLAAAGLALSILLAGVSLIPTYLLKPLVNNVKPGADVGILITLVPILLGVHALRLLLSAARQYSLSKLGERIILDLRTRLYEHLQILSMSFYDKHSTGTIMSRVLSDTGRVQGFVTWEVQQLIVDVLTLTSIGVFLFYVNWRLAVLVLTPVPVLAVATKLFSGSVRRLYRKAWTRWSNLSATLADAIPGVSVVKAFAQEGREIDRFNGKAGDIYETHLHIASLSASFFPLMGFLMSLGALMLWWVGGRQVLAGGGFTPGDLMMFIGFTWQFYGPIERLSNFSRALQEATTSAERVFEVLDMMPEVEDRRDAVTLPPVRGHLRFEHVSFAYEGGEEVLHDVSFELKPGQTLGLVGPSGAGKTTLVKLILRFYDPTEGRITLDGHDLREVRKESLRRQVGMVLQEPFLFSGSIAENIAYGRPDARPEEVIAAAKVANIHDFITTLPEGYDFEVGERGHRLSGGERQRVSIARAVLKDPRILILDEATSFVDTETESLIQEALNRLMMGRTAIVIAHRLTTVKNADKILVLEEGRIVEEGTHQQLLRNNGLYGRLCRMQAQLSVIAE